MSKVLIALVAGIGVLFIVAPAQSQQQCPPGQTGNAPYCQTPPGQTPPGQTPPRPTPPGQTPLPAACDKFTAKLSLARATFNRRNRTIDILAPITGRASGSARITLHAAGTKTTFSAPVDSQNGYIRVIRRIRAAQARLGTGILTINYPGDADTRPQVVRLRAANTPSNLELSRPTITTDGRLRASGTVSARSRGVVRVQIEYVNRAAGQTVTRQFKATINRGRWNLNVALPAAALAQIAARCGTVHSYTLFTGYIPRRIRGEMRAFEVLPSR